MSEADETDETLCDYCGSCVDLDEVAECEPDETGHCILCGLPIGDAA